MSNIGFTFKHLRNDREKEIFLIAFWDGVAAGDDLKKEMLQQEREWASDGRESAQDSIQQGVGET